MKKITKLFLLMIITVFLMTITVFAADFSVNANLEKNENEYTLKISLGDLSNVNRGITGYICDLEYDREVFETVALEDITALNGWEDLTYNPNNGSILVLRTNYATQTDEEILEIKLHKKENAKSGTTQIKLTNIQATNAENDLEADDVIIDLTIEVTPSIVKNILITILIIVVILFVFKTIIKAQVKRRKRR